MVMQTHIQKMGLNLFPAFSIAVADPGFPRGGGANPKGGAPTYYLANFARKLHEKEEIWGQRGGVRPSRPPLDPPLHWHSVKDFTQTQMQTLHVSGPLIYELVEVSCKNLVPTQARCRGGRGGGEGLKFSNLSNENTGL